MKALFPKNLDESKYNNKREARELTKFINSAASKMGALPGKTKDEKPINKE
jgi:hypothetical protein